MEWLINLIKKIFNKKEVKLLEAPKVVVNNENDERSNFVMMLRQTADLERDDRNGYKIIKNIRLKDMI